MRQFDANTHSLLYAKRRQELLLPALIAAKTRFDKIKDILNLGGIVMKMQKCITAAACVCFV